MAQRKSRGAGANADRDRAEGSASYRRWTYYVVTYNKYADAAGSPRIPTLRDLAATKPAPFGLLAPDVVLDMQLKYYADLIDRMAPLTEAGFTWLNSQKRRAQGPRTGQFHDLLHLLVTAPQYSEYTNRQLWEELKSIANNHGVTVVEPAPDVIEWDVRDDDADAERSGEIKYRSFETKLSLIRRSTGTLKRPRKGNNST